jgi:hypothetical protein
LHRLHAAHLLPGADMNGTVSFHRNIFQALYLFQSHDQVDVMSLTGCEPLARWPLVIEVAVWRSPRSPDFSPLDSFLPHSWMSREALTLGLQTQEDWRAMTWSEAHFDHLFAFLTAEEPQLHISEVARAPVFGLKNLRLQREEIDSEEKRVAEGDGMSGGNGPPYPKEKDKNESKDKKGGRKHKGDGGGDDAASDDA